MSMFSDAVINFWLNVGDAKKQLDGLQGAFAKTADKIQNNFIAKLGGLALGGVGIKGLTNVYDEALKIQNLAESWNLPVEKVSAFTNAFSLLGGSTDDAPQDKFIDFVDSLREDYPKYRLRCIDNQGIRERIEQQVKIDRIILENSRQKAR